MIERTSILHPVGSDKPEMVVEFSSTLIGVVGTSSSNVGQFWLDELVSLEFEEEEELVELLEAGVLDWEDPDELDPEELDSPNGTGDELPPPPPPQEITIKKIKG